MQRVLLHWLAFLLWAMPLSASNDPATLAREAMGKLDAAHLSLSEAKRASDRVAALTETIRAFEDGLDALRQGLRHVAQRQAAIQREFDAESETVSQFLAVLLSIQSASGPLGLLHPFGPLGAARSGMIVSELTPEVQRQAEVLRLRLEEVAVLRTLQENAVSILQQGLSDVQRARTELSLAISNRTDLPQRFLSDPTALQGLINSAETLDGFASGLADIEYSNGVPEVFEEFSGSLGRLQLPVSGRLLRQYNEADAAGVRRPGMLIATQQFALVTNPWPATLRYAGPLLDYGNVMILEPEAGVLMILAGLDQVFGETGQVLAVQTALGLMGGKNPDPDGIFNTSSPGAGSEASETLYIELRVDGQPVDPAIWFAQTKE